MCVCVSRANNLRFVSLCLCQSSGYKHNINRLHRLRRKSWTRTECTSVRIAYGSIDRIQITLWYLLANSFRGLFAIFVLLLNWHRWICVYVFLFVVLSSCSIDLYAVCSNIRMELEHTHTQLPTFSQLYIHSMNNDLCFFPFIHVILYRILSKRASSPLYTYKLCVSGRLLWLACANKFYYRQLGCCNCNLCYDRGWMLNKCIF